MRSPAGKNTRKSFVPLPVLTSFGVAGFPSGVSTGIVYIWSQGTPFTLMHEDQILVVRREICFGIGSAKRELANVAQIASRKEVRAGAEVLYLRRGAVCVEPAIHADPLNQQGKKQWERGARCWHKLYLDLLSFVRVSRTR